MLPDISLVTSSAPLIASRFRCLQARLLYEQCGHIEILLVHELPCAKAHRGWLPETSPLVQVKECFKMSHHFAIKKSSCEKCNISAPVETKGFFAKWGKGKAEVIKVEREMLPIQEVIKRRREWKGEIGRQEWRKARREEEEERAKKLKRPS